MDPLATLFAVLVVECFLQSIKSHAVGVLNLAVGPRVSH
jgi:hypothetical protein